MRKEHGLSFRSKAVGMDHGDMCQERVCQQLGVGKSHLHVRLQRDKLIFGLMSQPNQGRKTVFYRVTKEFTKITAEKRHQSAQILAERLK